MATSKTILISGASGFLGGYLTKHLLAHCPGAHLHSIGVAAPAVAEITHHACDLTQADAVKAILGTIRPEQIYHLAGSARVTSEISFPEYFQSNFLTTVSLARAIESLALKTAIFLASSVHVYGNHQDTVDEATAVSPLSPYAHSKYLAECSLQELASRAAQVHVVIGRLYSCIGPGQAAGFVTSDLARRLASLAPGKPLHTRSLIGFRRFLDVRDAVALLPMLLESPQLTSGEIVNIASAEEATIQEIVARLIHVSGRAVTVESEAPPERLKFTGLRISVDKLKRIIPLPALRPLDDSLRDIWESAVNSLAVSG